MEGFSSHDELVLLGLLAAITTLLALAPILRVPYPILLVLGGLGLAAVPGVPTVELPPDLVLVVVLPPLLYSAAFFASLRDLRANVRPISLLSVGLVVATTLAVAVVAHAAIDGLPWAAAFVLGALVSPTDPVAATAILGRTGTPRRVVTVLEGESMINDATALVAYRFAVAAVLTGSFSIWEAGLDFLVGAVGGIAVGLAVGAVVAYIRRRIADPTTQLTISLLTAYFAYLPAEALELSAVLAAVTVGVYMGWQAPTILTPQTRLQGFGVWDILVFLLNSLVFALVGLQLPVVLDGLSGEPVGGVLLDAAIVTAAVIAVRFAWVYPATYGARWLSRRVRERDPSPPRANTLLVAFTGMRGAVTVAAALALPLSTDAGGPFPQRDRIIFVAFSVVLVTLVVQGLGLPLLVKALRLDEGGGFDEESKARIHAARAALEHLDQVGSESWVRDDTAERLRGLYQYRQRRFSARFDDGDDGEIEGRSQDFQRLRRELLEAERSEILRLRDEGHINEDVKRRLERDLDLDDVRLDA